MSSGFSVGDMIALGVLAWDTYNACKAAPEAFGNISSELESLCAVIEQAELLCEEKSFLERQQKPLAIVLKGCRKVLMDLQVLVGNYKKLGKSRWTWERVAFDKEEVKEIRARLTSNVVMLAAFIRSVSKFELR
jgi:hypothetical protein